MLFSTWLENKIATDAILGVVGAGADLSPEERRHLLSRNTKDFGSDIIKRLKGLGVVKSVDDGRGKYGSIVSRIEDGIKISDLVKELAKD